MVHWWTDIAIMQHFKGQGCYLNDGTNLALEVYPSLWYKL